MMDPLIASKLDKLLEFNRKQNEKLVDIQKRMENSIASLTKRMDRFEDNFASGSIKIPKKLLVYV